MNQLENIKLQSEEEYLRLQNIQKALTQEDSVNTCKEDLNLELMRQTMLGRISMLIRRQIRCIQNLIKEEAASLEVISAMPLPEADLTIPPTPEPLQTLEPIADLTIPSGPDDSASLEEPVVIVPHITINLAEPEIPALPPLPIIEAESSPKMLDPSEQILWTIETDIINRIHSVIAYMNTHCHSEIEFQNRPIQMTAISYKKLSEEFSKLQKAIKDHKIHVNRHPNFQKVARLPKHLASYGWEIENITVADLYSIVFQSKFRKGNVDYSEVFQKDLHDFCRLVVSIIDPNQSMFTPDVLFNACTVSALIREAEEMFEKIIPTDSANSSDISNNHHNSSNVSLG